MAYQVNPTTGELEWTSDDNLPGSNPNRNQPASSGADDGGDGIDYPALARGLSSYFGGAARSQQQQNNFESTLGLDRWSQQEMARLRRDQFAENAPGQRLRTSARASLLNTYQPTSVSFAGQGSGRRGVLPTISGGPSQAWRDLDPRTRELSGRVMADELAAQEMGGLTGRGGDRAMSRMPRAGGNPNLERLAGGSGLANALLNSGGPRSSGDISRLIQDIRDHYRDRTPTSGYSSQGHFDENGQWVTDSDMDSFTGPWWGDDQFTGPQDDPLYGQLMDYYNQPPEQQYINLPGYGMNLPSMTGGSDGDSEGDDFGAPWWEE